jgi:AdoMet-dependent rRNA methyltransferase SPB1
MPPSKSEARGIISRVDGLQAVWEPAERAAYVREHKSTTAEVRALCSDLQVLGRSEFKHLLRWRLKVRGDLLKAEADALKATAVEGSDEEEAPEEKDPEAELLAEMERLRSKVDHDLKISRKKMRELKKKAKLRLASSAATAGIGEEVHQEDDSLFDLNQLRGRAALQAIGVPALAPSAVV